MLKKIKKILFENKISSYTISKITSLLSFFHIPTILGHDNLKIDKNNNGTDTNNTKLEDEPANNNENTAIQKIESGFGKVIGRFNNAYDKYNKEQIEVEILKNSRGPLKVGLYIIFAFFGILFTWMLFAKIDGSVVAQGQVVFAQNKQNIQHQTGGTIKNILVKEGDFVHYGQTLMTMHDSDIRASYNISYSKILTFKAMEARFLAEKNQSDKLILNANLVEESKHNEELQNIISSQERLFNANIELFKNKLEVIKDKKEQLKNDIKSIEAQEALLKQRVAYTESQLSNAEKLFKEKNIPMSSVLNFKSQRDALLQEEQRFVGLRNTYSGQMLNLIEEEIIFKNNRLKELEDNLREMQTNIVLEQERVNALQDSLEKNIIKAAADGVVNNLRYKNSGEIVQSGATIMEIIPSNDYLIIEAKLMAKEINALLNTGIDLFNYNQQDINHLLDAKINLVSYSNRRYKKLKGSVFYVATDIATDPRYGFTYYLLKVMISKKELEYATMANMKLYPGMPAEIYVRTEPRTPFNYFISPITASMGKAFIDS